MQLELQSLDWRIVNDGVMGGLSHSVLDIHDDCLVFRGELSTENLGGFVSVLGRLPEPLKDFCMFRLTVAGDGRHYQLRLRENESARSVAWRGFFNTHASPSVTELALDEFDPVMRGQSVIGARPLGLTPIHHVGFMLTSRMPGPFELKVFSLEVLQAGTHETAGSAKVE